MDLFLYINEKFNSKLNKPLKIFGKLAEKSLKTFFLQHLILVI